MVKSWKAVLERLDDWRWILPQEYKPGMRAPGMIFASEKMLNLIGQDQAIEQVANVAFLPGIVNYSMAMPDIHWGYGFPIGGVAAMRVEDGVISPGGVGFDINCGTRLLRTNLSEEEVRPRLKELVDQIFRDIPAGIGGSGLVRVSLKEIDAVLTKGARWALEQGYAWPEDVATIEGGGALPGANPDKVSRRAKERGGPQLGTLGSGNHFLELQVVDELFDPEAAAVIGDNRPRPGHRLHPHRLARVRSPDVSGLPGRYGGGGGALRYPPTGQAAGLRSGEVQGGTGLLERDDGSGQLRLLQPPAHRALDTGSVPTSVRPRRA